MILMHFWEVGATVAQTLELYATRTNNINTAQDR